MFHLELALVQMQTVVSSLLLRDKEIYNTLHIIVQTLLDIFDVVFETHSTEIEFGQVFLVHAKLGISEGNHTLILIV
jgi:hypothetical protein